MSEEKKERTLEEVTNEHNQLCFRAGMLQYRMKIEQAEVDSIFEQILKLNQEAAAINEAKKSKEAETPKTELKEVTNG